MITVRAVIPFAIAIAAWGCSGRYVLGTLADAGAPPEIPEAPDASIAIEAGCAETGTCEGGLLDPCAGKGCGAICPACAPDDPDCFGIEVFRQCNASGLCSTDPPACGKDVYVPCAGKQCGQSCTLCAPGATDCFESAMLKVCSASGECTTDASSCPR